MKAKRDKTTNKLTFWKDNIQVYPVSIKGNIAKFETGEIILF